MLSNDHLLNFFSDRLTVGTLRTWTGKGLLNKFEADFLGDLNSYF